MGTGKTHMPDRDEAKALLAAIDTATLIGLLLFTFARIDAVNSGSIGPNARADNCLTARDKPDYHVLGGRRTSLQLIEDRFQPGGYEEDCSLRVTCCGKELRVGQDWVGSEFPPCQRGSIYSLDPYD
jgi:hypothetical protein